MRKLLITTTALVAVSLVPSVVFAADKVKLELGGFTSWFVVGAWNNNNYEKATGQSFNNVDVKGWSDLTFQGSTKLDNGLDVGAYVMMRAGTNTGVGGNLRNSDLQNMIDQSYLYVNSGYGKVVVGVTQNAAHQMHVMAPEATGQWGFGGFLTGNSIIQIPQGDLGGVGGGAPNGLVNNPIGVLGINGNQINSTSILPGNGGTGATDTLSYFTPTYEGITLGASYAPNDRKNVRGATNLNDSMHDLYVLTGNYTNKFGDVSVAGSLGWGTAMIGKNWEGLFSPSAQLNSASGQRIYYYNAGLNLTYQGFTLGGSFRWNDHRVRNGGMGAVGLPNGAGYSMTGQAWDAGLQYATGPWAWSLTYYGSQVDGLSKNFGGKKEEVAFYQTSGQYALGPGINLQALIGYGDYKASTSNSINGGARGPGDSNKGWAAMTGIAVNF